MTQSITILFQVLETNSGTVFLVEEKNQNKSIKYYAYQFRQQEIVPEYFNQYHKILEKSNRKDLFRKYQKIHLDSSQFKQQLYLFNYYEESQFLDRKVMDYAKKKKKIDSNEIQIYLKNLLVALYELHSNQIPGRIFSIYNVLVVQPSERLVLMDFGFGPDIQHDKLDILAPPEYLEQIINKNENKIDFNLKFDSWLLGAFLYHLIKFKSINQVEVGNNQSERYKYDRKEQFYEYLQKIKFIPCQTKRYQENLLSFVENLLTCDRKKRLSFYEIYQHKYIQDLKLEGQSQFLQFYQKCEYIQDQNTNDLPLDNKIFNSPKSKLGQFQQEPNLIQSQDNISPKTQKPNIRIISTHSILSQSKHCPDYLSIIMNKPQFSNSSFYNYWFHIQLDCLRCYILENTANKIIPILSKFKHPYEQVFAYFIKKMHLLILREMNNYLKSDFYQYKPDPNWQIFLYQHQKDLLRSDQMNSYLEEITGELQNIFQQHCQIHIEKDSQLSEIIKQSLIDDKLQNFNMILNAYEFFLNGYADAIQILLQFISSQIVQNQQQQQQQEELVQFKRLIYFCVDINISFQSQTFQEQFKELGQQNQKVQPSDIIKYLGITNRIK